MSCFYLDWLINPSFYLNLQNNNPSYYQFMTMSSNHSGSMSTREEQVRGSFFHRTWFGHVVAIMVVLIWGVTFINTKKLLQSGLMPHEIFVIRFLLAYICIWPFSPKRVFCRSWTDELVMLMLGLTGGSLYFLTENTAVGITHVNNVALIVCTAPLLTTLLVIAFYKSEKANRWIVLGSVVALVGVALVIFNGQVVFHLNPLGDALALAASACWAVCSLLLKQVSGRYGAVFITRKIFFYGLVTMLPWFLVEPWCTPLSCLCRASVVVHLLFLGVVASFVCFLLWSWAIKRIGAITTTNYVYLNPLSTLVASAIFLSEPMTWMAYLGCALILQGLYLSNKRQTA